MLHKFPKECRACLHHGGSLKSLDKAFFGPLTTPYATKVDKCMVDNPGKSLSQTYVAGLFQSAYSRTATAKEAEHSFHSTGSHPNNPDIFSDEDFASSRVTGRCDEPGNLMTQEGNIHISISEHGPIPPSSAGSNATSSSVPIPDKPTSQ
jgi:hypothetical protein